MVPRFESATNPASGESPLLKATYVDDDPISQTDASGECWRRIKAQFREDTFIGAAKPTLTTGGLGSKAAVPVNPPATGNTGHPCDHIERSKPAGESDREGASWSLKTAQGECECYWAEFSLVWVPPAPLWRS
jgi:hypothetical protein